MIDFEQAKTRYQNASSLFRACVKIRLFNCYPEEENEEAAFCMAVQDEIDGKPLPGKPFA